VFSFAISVLLLLVHTLVRDSLTEPFGIEPAVKAQVADISLAAIGNDTKVVVLVFQEANQDDSLLGRQ